MIDAPLAPDPSTLDQAAGKPRGLDLFAEVRQAEEDRDRHLTIVPQIIDAYVGATDGNTGANSDWPVNHPYEWQQLVLPSLTYEYPGVSITSSSADDTGQTDALEAGTDTWMRARGCDQTFVAFATDFSFAFCAALVAHRPWIGAYDQDKAMPAMYRLSPKQVFWDTRAMSPAERKFVGYKYSVSKPELLERATREMEADPASGWLLPAIQGAQNSPGEFRLRDRASQAFRDNVTVYCVWTPEEAPNSPGTDAGFNGSWHTFIGSDTGMEGVKIREAVPAFCPPDGPIEIWGAFPIPDSQFHISPLGGVWHAMVRVNAHAKAVDKAAESYKRTGFVPAGSDIAKKLKESPDQSIYELPDSEQAKIKTIETGGASAEQIEALGLETARLDRVSGITDAMRGNVDPDASATADAIADAASNKRLAFLKSQFQGGIGRTLRKVVWYLANDSEVEFELGQQYAEEYGYNEPVFIGGPAEDPLTGFPEPVDNGYDLRITPFSMERVSEATQQRQATVVTQVATEIMPLVPQMPYVPWEYVIDQLGNANNMPGLGRKMMEGLSTMLAMQPTMGPAPALPGPSAPELDPASQPMMPGELLGSALMAGGR